MNENKELFNRIKAGLEEAIAFAEERDIGVTLHRIAIPDVDVKTLRNKLKMSQDKFSAYFGIPKTTLQNWEQHRREPDTTAKLLLAVIDKYPEEVHDAVQGDRA